MDGSLLDAQSRVRAEGVDHVHSLGLKLLSCFQVASVVGSPVYDYLIKCWFNVVSIRSSEPLPDIQVEAHVVEGGAHITLASSSNQCRQEYLIPEDLTNLIRFPKFKQSINASLPKSMLYFPPASWAQRTKSMMCSSVNLTPIRFGMFCFLSYEYQDCHICR